MGKLIQPTSYHLPTGGSVLESKTFIYLITLYKYTNRCVELLDSKYLSTTAPLKIINNNKRINKKDYFCIEFIDLVGVPKSFIEENDLKVDEIKVKGKKK